MSFVDRVLVEVKAGNGGDGCVSFLREAFRPRGGPDGGDGGDGGSIKVYVTTHRSSLRHLASRLHYKARSGENGGGKRCAGKSGEDLTLEVPPGTLIYALEPGQDEPPEGAEPVADLTEHDFTYVLARGGRGGHGNARFATALNQAPRVATLGSEGTGGRFLLELKLIAQVGIVGLPNAGKSTFISRVSNAKPRIANYPFTTLTPNLGVVPLGYEGDLVIADIPGLIEGASEGKGLGDEFLRHVERTEVLLHLVDATGPEFGGPEPAEAYRTIQNELERYPKAKLSERPQLLALNKCDAIEESLLDERAAALCKEAGLDEVRRISAVSGQGVDDLIKELALLVNPKPKEPWED